MNARLAGCLLLTSAVALMTVEDADAQTCFGIPLDDGQAAVGIRLDPEPDFVGLDAAVQLPIPVGLGVSWSGGNVDRYGGRLAFDLLESGAVRLCPFVGLEYTRFSGDASVVEVPVGIGGSLRFGRYQERGWGVYGLLAREREEFRSTFADVPARWNVTGEIGLQAWYGPLFGSVGLGTYSDHHPIRFGVRF